MEDENKTKVAIDSVEIDNELHTAKVIVPVMRVTIGRVPTLSGILAGMKEIRLATEKMPQEYVAITDISKLEISKFVRSVILFGMEASYKGLLSVKHQSLLSIVIIDKRAEGIQSMVDMLKRINSKQLEEKDEYSFHYEFVESNEEAVTVLESFWNHRPIPQ